MQKSIRTFILVGAAALAVSGCGKAKEAAREAAGVIVNADLQHSWQQERCGKPVGLAIVSKSQRETFAFSGEDVTQSDELFADGDCKDAAITIEYSGKFRKGDEVQRDVKQLNIEYTTVKVIAKNEAGRAVLSGVNFCGKSDWVVNAPVDLSEQAGKGFCVLDKMPRSLFDIYKVEGDRLFLGKGHDRTSAADRPTELDEENIFVKR